MSTTAQAKSPAMFSDEAWSAGYWMAESLGLTTPWAPSLRPVTRTDVDAIVSAVVNHGFEELYVEQNIPHVALDSPEATLMLGRLREHMKTAIAVEAIRQDCVMLTLPREVTDHPQRGVTRIRLIVPVRRLGAHS